jgi:hypothetical protein
MTALSAVPRRRLREELSLAHKAGAVPISDTTGMDAESRKRVERFRKARDLYISGELFSKVARIADVGERRLGRIFGRYLTVADDGRIAGERVFEKHWRPSQHPKREVPLDPSKADVWGAHTGLFRKLLEENSDLRKALVQALLRKGKGALQVNRLVGRELRKLLESLYVAHGIGEDEYPRKCRNKGLNALRRWMQTDFLPKHASDWIEAEHGPRAGKAITTPQPKPSILPEFDCYVDWMLDSVTVDLRTTVEMINAQGDVDIVEVQRFTILRLIELGYNATLAYLIVLAPQVSAVDVGNLLWRACAGWEEPPAVLPGLKPDPNGGFPVMVLAELRWRAPRRIFLDNALAHLSATVGEIVQHALGATLHLGTPGQPLERPDIESSFAQQARRLFHQLPGTAGTGPKDPQREKQGDLPPTSLLRVDAIEFAYHVMLSNQNGHPSTAAHGIPALERLRRAVLRDSIKAQPMPLSTRMRHMFFPRQRVRVLADLEHGRRPYVSFKRIRYSSPELQRRFDLIRQKVWARFDPDDLRVIVLYDDAGLEICRCFGEGRWGQIPHDERMRRLAMRNIDRASFGTMPHDSPLAALFARLQDQSPTQPSAALQLAHCLAVLGRHVKGDGLATSELARLIAGDAALEVTALTRPAANEPQEESGSSKSTQPRPAAEASPEPQAARPVPRAAVRRAA